MSKRVIELLGLALLFVAFGVSPPKALAQATNTGSISGTVTDNTGAVIPGATVTLTNTATSETIKTTSGDAGEFTFPSLMVGTYDLAVEKAGFKKYVAQNVILHLNDHLAMDVLLQTGNVSETVTVTAAAPLVQTQSSQLDTVITGEQVRQLPLVNRNFVQLVQLAPGNSSNQSTVAGFGGLTSTSMSFNGGRTNEANYSIDGTRNVDTGSNATLFNYPSVDAISEFNIVTNSYDAQYGRNAGGIINVVTRSGTRELHGDAYEFFRNDVLDARNPFVNTPIRGISPPRCFSEANPTADSDCKFKGPHRYNNFGYTLGGPVYIPGLYRQRDKTFFFFSEEFRRDRTTAVDTGTYPSALERSNALSAIHAAGGTVDQNALAIMNHFLPLPNAGGDNFLLTAPSPTNFRQELVRIDHRFSDKWSIWGRYIHDNQSTQEIGGLFNHLVFPGVADTATTTPADNVVVRLTTVITPSLLNEVGYDFARNAITSNIIGNGFRSNFTDINIPQKFNGNTVGILPNVFISGFSAPLAFFGPFHNDNPSHTVVDNLTYTRGTHTIKAGLLISREAKNEDAGGGFNGTFDFNGTITGNALVDFLEGKAASYNEGSNDVIVHERFKTFEWYLQDTWRVRNNVTLTLGLRHSIYLNPTDTNNLLDSFLPRLYDPAKAVRLNPNGTIVPGSGDLFNGLAFAGQNSPYGNYVQTNSYDTLSPRIGIAWDPWGDGKTSVRAGFGIYYDRSLIGIVEQNGFANPFAVQTISISNPLPGVDLLSNPLGGVAKTAITPISPTSTGDPFKVPTVNQWSLSVQRQLGHNMVVEAAYAGSQSAHLLQAVDINQPAPFAARSVGNVINLVRPYKGYGAIPMRQTTANSTYNSLQLSFRKSMSHGLMLFANYTFAKTLTNANDDRADPALDTYNLSLDRGPASFQRAHVFNLSYIWEVPFPKANNGLLRNALGGWQLGGNTFFWSGLPRTVTQSGDPLLIGAFGPQRPNLVGDPNGPKTIGEWFNTSAFSPALTTFGTAGRGIITGPGVNNWDIEALKFFQIKESLKLRFSADFINAFNHPNPGNPVLNINSSSFGQITSTGRDPRTIQFGLKLLF